MSVSEWKLPFIHPGLYLKTNVLTRWVYQTAMGYANNVVALLRELCVMNTELSQVTEDVTTQTFTTADNIVVSQEYSSTLPESPFGDETAQSIAKFMERPLLVYQSVTTAPSFTLWPWVEMLADGQVQNKVHNYRFLRGTMNIRITANATAFTYGLYCATVYYGDDTLGTIPNSESQFTAAINAEHYFLDLACKDEVVIKIPYFGEFPFAHTNPTFYTFEHARLCKVVFWPVVAAASANAAAVPDISIKAYCWVENTELRILEPNDINEAAGATAAQISYLTNRLVDRNNSPRERPILRHVQPQSYIYRECCPQSGPISGPLNIAATSVKSAGDSIIRATNLAHTAITATSKIAQLAGFSRPQGVENTTGYWPDLYGDTASTTGIYHARSLTMDPGSLVNGIHTSSSDRGDELSLAKIMERESYLDVVTVPVGADLTAYHIPVLPCYYHVHDAATGGAQFTNMGFASLPFKYWRGSIDVHFRVIGSNFHTGRMGVMWAPESFGSGGSLSILNISSNTIFDIRAGNVQTVRVNWGRSQPYAVVTPTDYSTTTETTPEYSYCNGYLRLYTVDRLLSPVPEATVKILITMTPGPDFELAVPNGGAFKSLNNFPVSSLTTLVKAPLIFESPLFEFTQATVEYPPRSVIPQSARIGSSIAEFNSKAPLDLNARHFGDPVISFRALLKRLQYDFTVGPGLPAPVGNLNGIYFAIPPYGIPSGQQNVTGTDVNWTNSKMNLLKYLGSAYAGIRGGTYAQIRARRHQNAPSGANRAQDSVPCTIIRADLPMFTRGIMTNSGALTPMGIFYSGFAQGTALNGSQTFDVVKSNPLVHIPYHSRRDFYQTVDYWSQGNMDDPLTSWPSAAAYLIQPNESVDFLGYDIWYATADDFDLLHYNGPKVLYFYIPTFQAP